jgi:GDP-4-dehydro-6-deoxy-D-mannose reductase
VFGGDKTTGRHSYCEQDPTFPRGEYGLSKLAAEAAAQMFDSENFRVYRARPFNHIGPGQDPSFVVPGFARRIAACEPGGTIETGNLSAKRDFCDVRDVTRGYRLIIEKQPAERCFVFGSGKSVTIQSVFDELVAVAGKKVRAQPTANLVRKNDEAEILANSALAERVLGWLPEIKLGQSLADVWAELR